MPNAVLIPDRFTIGVTALDEGQPRPARIVWYREGKAGIAFQDPKAVAPDLATDATPDASTDAVRLRARIGAIVRRGGAPHMPPSFERRRIPRD